MKFEEQFQQLEAILVRLERGEQPLDESLRDYEQGIAALRNCRQILSEAERRIEELTPGPAAAGEASADRPAGPA